MLHDLIQLRLYIAKCKVTNTLLLACNNSSIVNMIQLMHVTRQCKTLKQVNGLHTLLSAGWCSQ